MVRVSPPIPLLAGDVGAALYEAARASAAEVLTLAAEIARVPAPTNDESLRSEYVLSLMDDLGFLQVRVDQLGDVTGVIPGVLQTPQVLIAGHIDTVFPMDTPLSIHVGVTQSIGPGIGDNSLGVAAALKIPAMLARANVVVPLNAADRALLKPHARIGRRSNVRRGHQERYLKHVRCLPPSIAIVSPVIHPDLSDSRNAIRSATSSAVPGRPIG